MQIPAGPNVKLYDGIFFQCIALPAVPLVRSQASRTDSHLRPELRFAETADMHRIEPQDTVPVHIGLFAWLNIEYQRLEVRGFGLITLGSDQFSQARRYGVEKYLSYRILVGLIAAVLSGVGVKLRYGRAIRENPNPKPAKCRLGHAQKML
jgi:hypothetical protein